MSKLNGKLAVITGGSSGIGLATARRFVAEGADVIILGRRQSELDKAKLELGKHLTAVQGDVTKAPDLERLYQAVAEKGNLDIIVTSAGLVEYATLADATPEHFDKTFDLNVRGTFFSVQKLVPLMKKGGAIVLVASGMSYKGFTGHSTYAATKAAIRSFSRTWAAELKGRGIRVNTLSPGAIETPMLEGQATTKEAADALRATYASITPLGRIGRADEIAAGALFLASDESSYSTGIDLIADGGITQL